MLENEDLRNHLATGVDAKIMQYEENAQNISDDTIDFPSLLGGSQTYLLINMERHQDRYKTSLEQLKKLSIKDFIHLKGTDGKDKNQLQTDLTTILSFIKSYNDDVIDEEVKINEFSEVNIPGVNLQDGPLGCYCSHLRAMIYGYLRGRDYTIIIEDDISITNTENIKNYIPQIPKDWDIIFLNSRGKNVIYKDSFYKFEDEFHSGHFYIIKNSSIPKILKGMYPIVDQVDVLISFLHKELNMYNIPDTVYQKNLETNTQNNLDIIFSSPNYIPVTDALYKIEELLNYFSNEILPENESRNQLIVKHLMYDVIYNFILTNGNKNQSKENIEDFVFENPYFEIEEYILLEKFIGFFLQCAKKGINPKISAKNLANVLLFTIHKFKDLHNTYDETGGIIKALGFGATSHTFKVGDDMIIKRYNKKLRWATDGHDNSRIIKSKEMDILWTLKELDFVPKIYDYDSEIILLEYKGESLYDDFNLPKDWKKQITNIFSELTNHNVFYPEFRLQNILILHNKMSFVDFGLAEKVDNCDNNPNLNKFIKHLELLEKKFEKITNLDERHRLISTLLKNVL